MSGCLVASEHCLPTAVDEGWYSPNSLTAQWLSTVHQFHRGKYHLFVCVLCVVFCSVFVFVYCVEGGGGDWIYSRHCVFVVCVVCIVRYKPEWLGRLISIDLLH